ncbi:MAG TPA: EF-hand domain-containing protein, partial [Candidatus Sumerlaeota bacterium]|nr:EF-hand domain-containing protein [Candidatus Sumerlaeota bacterium]
MSPRGEAFGSRGDREFGAKMETERGREGRDRGPRGEEGLGREGQDRQGPREGFGPQRGEGLAPR